MANNIQYGTSTLSELINQGSMYIDKTARIYDLISRHTKRFFLSRPRRFGKSLLIDTLSEIFQGNRELFKGLAIYDKDYDWKKYAIIRIDMSRLSKPDPELFKTFLIDEICSIASGLKIDLSAIQKVNDPGFYMTHLLRNLQNKGQKAVILVDECEYPIIGNIDLPHEEVKVFLNILKSFYTTLKSFDSVIHFIFLTGVTRIAYTSIFSGINNLDDISFDPSFWDILGYTQEELISNFGSNIDEGAKLISISRSDFIEKIKSWYDGYRFSPMDSSVYNPADINLFFTKNYDFYPYWTDTGTSTFMVELLSTFPIFDFKTEFSLPRSSRFIKGIIDITKELGKEELIRLLYQSGYLTVKSGDPSKDKYYLGFPNYEVDVSFNSYIVESVWGKDYEFFLDYTDVGESLIEGDIDKFKSEVKRVFASLQKTPQKYHENAVELVLSLLLRMAGSYEVFEQLQTGEGLADIVFISRKTIYIIELKMDSDPQVALKQIVDKKYAQVYLNNKKYNSYSILAIGLCFNSSNCSYRDCDTSWIRKI